MPTDNVVVEKMLIDVAGALRAHAAYGCAIVRCRVYPEESWIAHIEQFGVLGRQTACTVPMFIKNWGNPIGYHHLCIEPSMHEVYGWNLPAYLLQACKGLQNGAAKEPLWTMESESIKPFMIYAAEVMDEAKLDRVYFGRFIGEEKIGEGYGYCLRKMLGEPSQFKSGFKGTTLYQTGLISHAEPASALCSSEWKPNHLDALDDAIHAAGLESRVGHNGGNRPAKSPLRTRLQGMFQGVTSLEQC